MESIKTINPNLRPWKPGQSGNPGGRPKGAPKISSAILRMLMQEPQEIFVPRNKADMLADCLYQSAIKGDSIALREILERTEGKVAQGLQLSHAQLATGEIIERLIEAFSEAGR